MGSEAASILEMPNNILAVKYRVTINRTVYEGVARVTDPDALRRALVTGIGRSKTYNCGLMTLARVRRG